VEFALCAHRYAYFHAWFDMLGLKIGPELRVGFGAASTTVSYPAVRSGVWCSYYPHGLLARTVVFPEFSEVLCSNRFEADHIRTRLPRAVIRVECQSFEPVETEQFAAIASGYLDDPDSEVCRSFLEWARKEGLPIFVREHPRIRPELAERWRGVPGVVATSVEGSVDDFIQRYRPRLMATWYSTTILDALSRGVLPVALCGVEPNGVIPIGEISISWPKEEARLRDLLGDRISCRALAADFQAKLR
jgi:hypothetical protein